MPFNAIVRIYKDHHILTGTGFLAVPGKIITTASSLTSAGNWYAEDTSGLIEVDFPYLEPERFIPCRIGHYYHPLPDGTNFIIELNPEVPLPGKAHPAPLIVTDILYQHPFHSYWLQDGREDTIRGHLKGIDHTGWLRYQFDLQTGTLPVSIPTPQTFLGTPIWDEKLKGVVGIFTDLALGGTNTLKRVGLTLGVELLNPLIPHLRTSQKKNEYNPQIEDRRQVELVIAQKGLPSELSEDHMISLLLTDLQLLLFNAKNDLIRVWSALRHNELYLVLEMSKKSADRLSDLYRQKHAFFQHYDINEPRIMNELTRVKENVGPLIPGGAQSEANSAEAKTAEGQLSDLQTQIAEFQERYDKLLDDMAQEMGRFVDAAHQSLDAWYDQIYKTIQPLEYPVSNKLSSKKKAELEKEVNKYRIGVKKEVNHRLRQDSSLWWHRRHLDQVYLIVDQHGQRRPTGEIDRIIHEISEAIRPVLVKYGYSCTKYWEMVPYGWSLEMKDSYQRYEELRAEAATVYNVLNAAKKLRAREQGIEKAAKV